MAVFTIETPDGRKLDIEADDEGSAIAGAQDWVAQNPKPPVDVAGELAAPFKGFNEGLDAMINLPGAAINLGARGVNKAAEALGYEAPFSGDYFGHARLATRANADYEPQTVAGRYAKTIGEMAGASVLPEAGMLGYAMTRTPQALAAAAPMVRRAAAAPAETLKAAIAPTVGAGIATQGARDAELGPVGEILAGLAGGFAGPAIYAPMARFGGGVKSTLRYGNEQIRAARNPEEAAIDRTAEDLVNARTPPEEIRGRLLSDARGEPILSRELAGRGITEEQLADMISRRMGGEPAASIGRQYGIAPGTVDTYVNRFTTANPTPLTIPDVVTELRGAGGAMPVLRTGRANFAIADNAPDAAQALFNRQTEQSGRVANIIQRSGGRQDALNAEMDRLRGVARAEERDAYTTVYQHDNPVLIDDVVREARRRAVGRAGRIGAKLNEAVDLFFTPELREPLQAPATRLKIIEARERLQSAIARGRPQHEIDRLRRRARVAEEQDEFSRPLKQTKVGRPIQDVRRFVDARQELDQMIQESFVDHRPTPLTGVLTEFRTQINTAARANNPALASADARFYGNRSAERIIEMGQELGKNPTQQSREILRDFREMTPIQQELLRVSFEQKMAGMASGKGDNVGSATQFSTRGFRQQVEGFYPGPARGQRGPARTEATAVQRRGQEMTRNLNREAITTGTGNFMTGRANSPTAYVASDIESQMANAQAAADLATGRFGRVIENLSKRLAKQIGQQAAAAQLRILTEMDLPAQLRLLNRLDQSARTAAQRQQMVHRLREFRRPELVRPATALGTLAISQERRSPEKR